MPIEVEGAAVAWLGREKVFTGTARGMSDELNREIIHVSTIVP